MSRPDNPLKVKQVCVPEMELLLAVQMISMFSGNAQFETRLCICRGSLLWWRHTIGYTTIKPLSDTLGTAQLGSGSVLVLS